MKICIIINLLLEHYRFLSSFSVFSSSILIIIQYIRYSITFPTYYFIFFSCQPFLFTTHQFKILITIIVWYLANNSQFDSISVIPPTRNIFNFKKSLKFNSPVFLPLASGVSVRSIAFHSRVRSFEWAFDFVPAVAPPPGNSLPVALSPQPSCDPPDALMRSHKQHVPVGRVYSMCRVLCFCRARTSASSFSPISARKTFDIQHCIRLQNLCICISSLFSAHCLLPHWFAIAFPVPLSPLKASKRSPSLRALHSTTAYAFPN